MGILKQIICTAIACYLCLILGLMYAWPSSTAELFRSKNTVLNRPMTEMEISLLGSLPPMSAMMSIPVFGYLNDNLGRKNSCILLATLQTVSWLIISSCNKVEVILLAVFMSGLCACVLLLVPIYVGEICQKSIRGTMTSCAIFFMSTGMLISYILGGLLQYCTMNYVYLSMMLLGVLLMNIMKESPIFLMKNGAENKAAESVAYYRGVAVDSKEVFEELENMRKALNPKLDDVSSEEENLRPDSKPKKITVFKFLSMNLFNSSITDSVVIYSTMEDFGSVQKYGFGITWEFWISYRKGKSRSTRRALGVCLFMYMAATFQGLIVVKVYAKPVFEKAAPNLSASVVSILFGVICVIAGSVATFVVDRLGRRPLMIYTSIGNCVICLALGTQIHFNWGPDWLTPTLIYVYCLTYLCGSGTVPYVVLAEVFLPKVRSYVSVIAMEWGYICSFMILFIFNPLVTAIGLGPVFYLFSTVCFISAIFCTFYLPETKGLTVDVIQTRFETQWE